MSTTKSLSRAAIFLVNDLFPTLVFVVSIIFHSSRHLNYLRSFHVNCPFFSSEFKLSKGHSFPTYYYFGLTVNTTCRPIVIIDKKK